MSRNYLANSSSSRAQKQLFSQMLKKKQQQQVNSEVNLSFMEWYNEKRKNELNLSQEVIKKVEFPGVLGPR